MMTLSVNYLPITRPPDIMESTETLEHLESGRGAMYLTLSARDTKLQSGLVLT